MKLTKKQVAMLKNYQRLRNEPPTVKPRLWREKLSTLFLLVIVADCLHNALTDSASGWRYSSIGLAFAAGAILVANVVLSVYETKSWTVLREVANWDKVAELIRDNPFPEDAYFESQARVMEKPGLAHDVACVSCLFLLATIVYESVKVNSSSEIYAAFHDNRPQSQP